MQHCLLQPLSLLHISHLQPAAKSGVPNIVLPGVFLLDYDENTGMTLEAFSTQTYVRVTWQKIYMCLYIFTRIYKLNT